MPGRLSTADHYLFRRRRRQSGKEIVRYVLASASIQLDLERVVARYRSLPTRSMRVLYWLHARGLLYWLHARGLLVNARACRAMCRGLSPVYSGSDKVIRFFASIGYDVRVV